MHGQNNVWCPQDGLPVTRNVGCSCALHVKLQHTWWMEHRGLFSKEKGLSGVPVHNQALIYTQPARWHSWSTRSVLCTVYERSCGCFQLLSVGSLAGVPCLPGIQACSCSHEGDLSVSRIIMVVTQADAHSWTLLLRGLRVSPAVSQAVAYNHSGFLNQECRVCVYSCRGELCLQQVYT